MDLFGTIFSASLLLTIVRSDISKYSCTTLADLSQPCGCPLTKESFKPICGSDGKSYLSLCFLECQQTLDGTHIRVVKNEVCPKDLTCTCNAGYSPVCGSNGITYSNECVLNCNVKRNPSIRLKHRGKCEESNGDTRIWALRSKCSCNPTNIPICGSNSVTYANYCVLQCKAKTNPSIVFKHWGTCKEPQNLVLAGKERYFCTSLSDLTEPCGCILTKETFDPICAVDGKSYLNFCFLECQQTLDDTTINAVKKGACSKDSRCSCKSNYNPVCGSNGVTYTNECVLNCERKKFPSLSLKYRRKCEGYSTARSPEENDEPKNCCYNCCDCCKMQQNTCANGQWPYQRPCEFKCDVYKNKPTTTPKTRTPCRVTNKPAPDSRPIEDNELSKTGDSSNICYCASVNLPVCGTDHKTYANICVMHCNAKKDPRIKLKRWGPCGNSRLTSSIMRLLDHDDGSLRNRYFKNQNILIPLYRHGHVLLIVITVPL